MKSLLGPGCVEWRRDLLGVPPLHYGFTFVAYTGGPSCKTGRDRESCPQWWRSRSSPTSRSAEGPRPAGTVSSEPDSIDPVTQRCPRGLFAGERCGVGVIVPPALEGVPVQPGQS